MTEQTCRPTDAAAVAQIVHEHIKPQVVKITGQKGNTETELLILPKGLQAHAVKPFLDEYRSHPERRQGTATLRNLESLIEHVNRFKDADSVLYALDDMAQPSLQAVLDYHKAGADGQPRFGKHRAIYRFPISDEWKAWQDKNATGMSQAEFAEFLEDRITDVIAPPDLVNAPLDAEDPMAKLASLLGGSFASPTRLMELARGLSIRAQEQVRQATNLSTGEVSIQFTSEHQDEAGQPLKVPNLFLIAIPVFKNGPLYKVAVRLRYRLRTGQITWFYELHRTDKVFEHAFTESCQKAQADTGLPLFFGSPEA